jgi:purine-binding chemotaxis protein CheW
VENDNLINKFTYNQEEEQDRESLVGFIDIANEYITFRLGEESYAIEILRVKEIRSLMDITKVPKMPKYISGVINLRGDIIPVIDLAVKLNFTDVKYGEFSVIIVVELDERPIGILAEEVLDVQDIDKDKVSERVDVGTHIQSEFIHGIANIDEKPIMILEIRKLLDIEHIEAIE